MDEYLVFMARNHRDKNTIIILKGTAIVLGKTDFFYIWKII